MVDERRRQHLGEAASAAIPVLWSILAQRGWSHSRLAAEIGSDRGKAASLLYGDRRPGRDLSLRLLAIGVAIELWSQPLPEGWTVPHAADQTGPHKAVHGSDEYPAVATDDTTPDLTRDTG